MAVGRLVPPPSLPTEIARMTLAHLPAATSLESIYPFVCQLAAAALKVERVGIWFLDNNDTILKCANVYQMSKGTHSSGLILDVSKISCYVESLQRRRSLPVEIVEALPWTVELYAGYCEPLGITSILDAGIFFEGRLTGVVCHEHVGPVRDWSSEERHFAESLADFVASRLKSSSDEVKLTSGESARQPLTSNELQCCAEETFRVVSEMSCRLTSLMETDGKGSTIQKRLEVLNREISAASSEALKLLGQY
jgi:GAF domain-containing protein